MLALLERERMAERNQLGGALGGHDAREDRGVEHRALMRAMTAASQCTRHRRGQAHTRLGLGDAMGDGLGADIDHGGTRARHRGA